ncbi:hypothetical protein [Streptomyces silvisoli]|uniref:Uncharacterized protein n=1 Tax=Streptomyces silvisoli TaxID=3034235 RepID=A0ABT5ZM12_9ACTN|nr:hypothetical protein [Streptomyces silvisoli]MDF3290741.1 hypothetical protein [Streptomyces silvisoli]
MAAWKVIDVARSKCTGRSSQTGEPCKNFPIKGGTVCRSHGGAAPQVKAAAAARVVRERATAVLGKLDIVPVEDAYAELQQLAGELIALKDAIRGRVEALTQIRYMSESEQTRAELTVYSQLLRDCSAVLGSLARLSLDERMVRIKESQAEMVKVAIEGALRAAGLEGDALSRARMDVGRRLRVVSSQVVPAAELEAVARPQRDR